MADEVDRKAAPMQPGDTPADPAMAGKAEVAPAESPRRLTRTDSTISAGDAADGSLEAKHSVVVRLKGILDSMATVGKDQVLEALKELKDLGSLPTKVLSDTLIGKTVNQVAKVAEDEAVQASARDLVEQWRQAHRKRKAGVGGKNGSQAPALKRLSTSALGLAEESHGPETPRVDTGNEAPPSLEKVSTSDGASQEAPQEPPQPNPARDKVRQKIVLALGKEEEIETKGEQNLEERMRDPVALALEIEEALWTSLPSEKEYFSQARSLLFNLKDSKNLTFRFKLMVGFIKPSQVPTLTSEEMASDEKAEERRKMRQDSMEEIQTDWALKKGHLKLTGMFTCGKCKGTKTTYFQMQTRSSDEPMTTFVTCLTCNNRWKFC